MKKNVILAIIVSIVVLFSACKKETNLIKVQKIDPIEQKILNFKEQMKNPNKSDETISIDSAVWYMEAALNYTYCDLGNSMIENLDTVFVNINVEDDGSFIFSNVVNAYNQLESNLTNIIGDDNIIVADIEYVENANKSNEETISLVVARAPSNPPLPNQFYTITDNWKSGADLGNCSGTVLNRDLTDEIDKWLNRNRPTIGGVYYTEVSFNYFYSFSPEEMDMYNGNTWENVYNADGTYTIKFYTGPLVWSIGAPSDNELYGECVNATWSNYYAREMNKAINYIQQYKMSAPNRKVISWDVMEYVAFRYHGNNVNNEWFAKHRIYVNHGVPHLYEVSIK